MIKKGMQLKKILDFNQIFDKMSWDFQIQQKIVISSFYMQFTPFLVCEKQPKKFIKIIL